MNTSFGAKNKVQMINIKYKTSDNYLAGLNTLTKLIISLFFSILIIFLTNQYALFFLLACSFIYVLPLKKLKTILIIYLLISVMFGISLFFSFLLELAMQKMSSGGQHHGGGMKSYTAIVPFLRIAVMINFSIALILSSKTKKLVNVLKTLHAPRVLFLPVIVIFRFVPLFSRDIKQIHESIKIRIGSFNFFTMILKPTLFVRLIMAPTVIRALRSADELAAAAELKGISDTKMITNSSPEFFCLIDAVTLTIAGTVAYICMLLN